MKKHAKKALKHDVEVLGKTVPTLAIAALFLVGGGTAAVLTNYGTITGQATIEDQAVTVDGPSTVSYDGDLDVGQNTIDSFDISSNTDDAEVEYTVDLQREATGGDGANMNGVSTTLYDVSSSTQNLEFTGNEYAEVSRSYDTEEDVTSFTIDEGNVTDSYGGAVKVDADNDDSYEFQVDYLRNDAEGTDDIGYWEKSDGEWIQVQEWDGENHEVDSSEYGFYANLESDGTFTVEYDVEKAQPADDYRAHVVRDRDDKDEVGTTGTIGAEVATADGDVTHTVQEEGTRSYVMVNEWAVNLDPSYDYNVTAQVAPPS